jgi:Cu-processing system ATP-binding protein
MAVISATDLTKTYGDVTALDEFSLEVPKGDTFGLIGTNGAGKSTFLRLLVGHERPDSGDITVAGLSPSDGTAVRQYVGYMPEKAGFHPSLTGREELDVHARLRGVPADARPRRIESVLETVGLREAGDRRTGGYSKGMQRRLALAATLLGEPQALLLDEPTAGLDPLGVDAFNEIIREIRDQTDVTVLITSHVLPEIEELCEHVAIMHDGRVRATGPIDELRQTGGAVTVVVSFEGPVERDRVADALEAVDGARLYSHEGNKSVVKCPRGNAFDALSSIQETLPFAGFEVTEPGLRTAFTDVVTEGAET